MLPNFINRSITNPFNFALEQPKRLKIPSTFYLFFLQPQNFEPNIRFPTRKTRNYQLVSQKPVADTTTEYQTLNNGLPKRMYQRNVLITVEDVSKPSSRGCSRCFLKKVRGESRLNYWRWQSEDWSVGRRKNSESLKKSSSGTRFYLRMYASLACGSLKCDDNLLGSLKCKLCDITIYLWQSDTEKNGQSQRRKNKKRDCVSADHRRILARVFLFQLGERTFWQPVSLGFFIIPSTPGWSKLVKIQLSPELVLSVWISLQWLI